MFHGTVCLSKVIVAACRLSKEVAVPIDRNAAAAQIPLRIRNWSFPPPLLIPGQSTQAEHSNFLLHSDQWEHTGITWWRWQL